jgi:hypothetical protein
VRPFYVLREMGEKDAGIELSPIAAKAIAQKHPDVPVEVWKRLPELVADPLYVLPHKDGGHEVVVDIRTANAEPIIVGSRDGSIRTITPWNDAQGESGAERINRAILRAINHNDHIYSRDGSVPAEVLRALRDSTPASGPKAAPRVGTMIHITSRDDVVNKHSRIFYQPAYHGSPHIFDKFSLDKIGTGEGAQAYGRSWV